MLGKGSYRCNDPNNLNNAKSAISHPHTTAIRVTSDIRVVRNSKLTRGDKMVITRAKRVIQIPEERRERVWLIRWLIWGLLGLLGLLGDIDNFGR